MALEQSEDQEERVIQEGDEDLNIQGSCKRSNGIMTFVMDVLEFHPRFKRRMRQGFSVIEAWAVKQSRHATYRSKG